MRLVRVKEDKLICGLSLWEIPGFQYEDLEYLNSFFDAGEEALSGNASLRDSAHNNDQKLKVACKSIRRTATP